MKFKNKLAHLKYLDIEEGMICGRNPVPCIVCQEPTLFVDLISDNAFCSEECMEIFYTDE